MAFRSLENALFLGKRWGSTDRLCQNVAFRSLENASFLGESGCQQIGCAKLWLSEACLEKWGSTDKLCQSVAFRNLENALFLGKSGGQQIDCGKQWLSAAWKMLYFSGKLGGVDR